MPRSHADEKMEAALREYEAGVKAPVVCQRHGISERTLYRWRRASARARAESGVAPRVGSDSAAAIVRQALQIAVEMMGAEQRNRAVRALESRLHLSRADARRMMGVDWAPEAGSPSPGRVGMAVSRRWPGATLSDDFGRSKWLAVHTPPDRFEFLRNVGRSGVAAAAALRDAGCRDVITLHLGARTLDYLTRSGLRLWCGTPGVPLGELTAALSRGELAPWPVLVTLGRRR